jgi:hypothetical protein
LRAPGQQGHYIKSVDLPFLVARWKAPARSFVSDGWVRGEFSAARPQESWRAGRHPNVRQYAVRFGSRIENQSE